MKVAILGTGLIGGSIGLALRSKVPGATVAAYDLDPDAARAAVERGAADEVATSAADAARGAEVIFVATPVGAIAGVAADAARAAETGSLLTDVGSTKSRVVVEVERALPPGARFIGGHPMAGSEEEGIAAARAELFEGAWWILTPTDSSDPEAYQRLHALLTTLGARVMALRPDEHDELMAVISHLPQLVATALMNEASERERAPLLALAAGGFRDVTRVAASNPAIWVDICRENRGAIAAALGRFAERLAHLRDLVLQGDETTLAATLRAARDGRRNLPGKAVRGDAYEVRMPVPDRPGVLAEVTTTVGNLGINIEDLQITHSGEGGRGVLHLTIVGEQEAAGVSRALAALGYEPRAVTL